MPGPPEGLLTHAEPAWPSRLRRGHVVGVAAILLIAVAGAGVLLLGHQPVTEPLPAPTPIARTGSSTATPASVPEGSSPPGQPSGAPVAAPATSPAVLLVHVAGKVRRSGVVELREGARVLDALEASGGARRGVDLSTLNLARPVADGERILVGIKRPDVPGPPRSPGQNGPGDPAPAAPVDLNHATPEQLEELPGIGPVLAQRITEARDERGGFHAVEELLEVSGIAERRFAELSDRVTVR